MAHDNSECSKVCASALELTARGWPVFPCLDTKAPACPGGFKAATADPDAVRNLWRSYPSPLIGVATGAASGVDVLDIDPRHAGDEWLAANRDRLPPTRTHLTRSGGLHFVFAHADGVRNSAAKIAPGVDVRGDGGYVVWWPHTGLPVINGDARADWPEWLLAIIKPPPRSRPVEPPPMPGTGYAAAALRRGFEAVARAAEGTRNDTLNREAFALSRFARNGELAPQRIANALATAAFQAGLSAPEIAATLASAFRAAGIPL